MTVRLIHRSNAIYPVVLRERLGVRAPEAIATIGNPDILRRKTLALFCSVKCPGKLILKTYDLARELRDAEMTVISGFHSPMEKECFDILLRGKQPVILCLAKRLTVTRLPKEYRRPLDEGRLLLLSPFGEKVKRVTSETACFRNEFVAALADRVFVAYASHGGRTESFCRKVLAWGKPLLTFGEAENSSLIGLGGRPYHGVDSV